MNQTVDNIYTRQFELSVDGGTPPITAAVKCLQTLISDKSRGMDHVSGNGFLGLVRVPEQQQRNLGFVFFKQRKTSLTIAEEIKQDLCGDQLPTVDSVFNDARLTQLSKGETRDVIHHLKRRLSNPDLLLKPHDEKKEALVKQVDSDIIASLQDSQTDYESFEDLIKAMTQKVKLLNEQIANIQKTLSQEAHKDDKQINGRLLFLKKNLKLLCDKTMSAIREHFEYSVKDSWQNICTSLQRTNATDRWNAMMALADVENRLKRITGSHPFVDYLLSELDLIEGHFCKADQQQQEDEKCLLLTELWLAKANKDQLPMQAYKLDQSTKLTYTVNYCYEHFRRILDRRLCVDFINAMGSVDIDDDFDSEYEHKHEVDVAETVPFDRAMVL